jgi:hypothetical protein
MKAIAVVLSLAISGIFIMPASASKMDGKSYGSSDGGRSNNAKAGPKKGK